MEAPTQEKELQKARCQKPWNKLDKGIKLNRLLIFIKQESASKSLTDSQEKQLKTLLFHLCENNGLSKSNHVAYNPETMEIESISLIDYNETTHKYSVKKTVYKSKGISKSKSNIEKHLSRTK